MITIDTVVIVNDIAGIINNNCADNVDVTNDSYI